MTKKCSVIVFAWLCLLALAGCNKPVDVEQQVNELYNRMSQPERIAQLKSMYMDELFNEQGQLDTAKCRELIPYGIGHFSQFAMQQPRDPNVLRDRVAAVQDWLMHHTPNVSPGTYVLKVGASSTDIRLQKQVTLKGQPVVKPLREYYFSALIL